MYKTFQERWEETYSCKFYQKNQDEEKKQNEEDRQRNQQIENSYKQNEQQEKIYGFNGYSSGFKFF